MDNPYNVDTQRMAKSVAVRRIIDDTLAEFRRTHRTRRHPAEVTADRLVEDSTRYDFTGEERDAIALVVHKLRQIAGEA